MFDVFARAANSRPKTACLESSRPHTELVASVPRRPGRRGHFVAVTTVSPCPPQLYCPGDGDPGMGHGATCTMGDANRPQRNKK